MNICFLIHHTSKIGLDIEAVYLPLYLIMADDVTFISQLSQLVLSYSGLDKFADKHILQTGASMYNDNSEFLEMVHYFQGQLKVVNKLKSKKHKTRDDLVALTTFKNMINEVRELSRKRYDQILDGYYVKEKIPFIDDKIWYVGYRRGTERQDEEDAFIPIISDTLIEIEDLISLEYNIDAAFRIVNVEGIIDDYAFDYIKIPLWQFPPLFQISYEEVKHSRQQLQPPLQPFKEHLEKFRKEIYGLSFDDENKEKIRQSGMEIQSLFVQPVQQAVNNCIFLSKLKNAYADYIFLRFCLGITSAENIVEYYLGNKIIEPYMVSEIKKRIARESDLQASNVFCYFEAHNERNKEFTLAEMKNGVG